MNTSKYETLMGNKIPIILCIDVEPDGFFIDKDKPLPWKGFEELCLFFNRSRKGLEQATQEKVNFSWFFSLSPQVEKTYGAPEWPLTQYQKEIQELRSHGDELGLHPHPYRWVPGKNNWIEDRADQDWVNYCVKLAFESYQKVLGQPCRSFRFGSVWINNETLNFANRLGAKVDLTVEPNFKPDAIYPKNGDYAGEYPDYDDVPRFPYKKADHNFKMMDTNANNDLWMIPLTSGNVRYEYGRLERLKRKIFSPESLKPFPVTLKLSTHPKHFSWIVEEQLKKEVPYITATLRSDAGQSAKQLSYATQNVDYLMSHPQAKQFVFSTSEESLKVLDLVK